MSMANFFVRCMMLLFAKYLFTGDETKKMTKTNIFTYISSQWFVGLKVRLSDHSKAYLRVFLNFYDTTTKY